MKTVFAILALSQLLFTAFLVSYLRTPPHMTYLNLPFKNEQSSYKPGERMNYAIQRYNSSDEVQEYLITRELVNLNNGKIYKLSDKDVKVQPGYGQQSQSTILIPNIPSGHYVARGEAKLKGWISAVSEQWFTDSFAVDNGTNGEQ